MNVKTAKDHIEQILKTCEAINKFDESHPELNNEIGFLVDAVAFLADYRKVLENGIDLAELNII